jgi:hypothetical protein
VETYFALTLPFAGVQTAFLSEFAFSKLTGVNKIKVGYK